MKIKFISKITASAACAVIIFCMASMSISGNPVLSIRAGEGNIITNESLDKQMDIRFLAGNENQLNKKIKSSEFIHCFLFIRSYKLYLFTSVRR